MLEAREAVWEFLSDLLARDQDHNPLLHQYHGECALETWINRAALSRAISRRRREERHRKRLDEAGYAGLLGELHSGNADDPDTLLRLLLRAAIQKALSACPGDEFVMIHLLFGTGLRATEVARMFQCDRRTLKQRAEAACSQVRSTVQLELRRLDPWLNLAWSEILALLLADLPPFFDYAENREDDEIPRGEATSAG
jgi:DNA-directed RNA polymerase specialized sigma24 family protein